MPHADSSFVPDDIKTKTQFYAHVHEQLTSLLEDSKLWVSNLSQTSSLLYHSYLSSPLYGVSSDSTPIVNWCGFYIRPTQDGPLLVGPYNGRPACSSINPIKGKGVCADAYLKSQTVVVEDVEAYPGHIACDGDTKSEIVVPLFNSLSDVRQTIGVLDLDSTNLGTFDEEDVKGLEGVVEILIKSTTWWDSVS